MQFFNAREFEMRMFAWYFSHRIHKRRGGQEKRRKFQPFRVKIQTRANCFQLSWNPVNFDMKCDGIFEY